MKLAIPILAGGTSSRMGTPKQLLPYKNTHLLGQVIEQASATHNSEVYCVLGAFKEEIKKSIDLSKVNIIENTHFNHGLSTSIVAGIQVLQQLTYDAVLILLADQPLITTDDINCLRSAAIKNPHVIIASEYGKKTGVPALFPKNYFSELLQLKGDAGARALLNNPNTPLIKIPSNHLKDIDTPEEYRSLLNNQ